MIRSVSSPKVVYFKDPEGLRGTIVAVIINSRAWIPLSSVNIVMARVDSNPMATLIAYRQLLNTAKRIP